MPSLTITVTTEQMNKWLDANPIPDDPENPGSPLYTTAEWAEVYIKGLMRRDVLQKLRRQRAQELRDAIKADRETEGSW